MFNFGARAQKLQTDRPYLALDIGTEFIKTVLFRIDREKEIVEVIGYDRAPQKANAMQGALIINLQNVIDVVDVSIGNTLLMAEKVTGQPSELPRQAVMGIAGELVKGVVIVVNVEREDPSQKITQKEVDMVLDNIKEQAFASAKEEIAADTGIKTDQIEEISTVVNSAYIDGVKVDSPLGFTGKELTYKVFSTFAPRIHIESVKEVARSLDLEIQQIVVEPYALAMGVEHAREERFSGVFIDVGGGTTDIAMIDQGSIMGTKMFAFGGRVFTKRVERELGIDQISAERKKVDYSDQKLTDKETKELRKSFAKDIPVWLDGVELALAEFDDVVEYPANFYICGGGALLPDINSGLLAHPWLQVLPFKKFPKFSYLFPNQIASVVDLTRTVTQPMDVTPMALARMALDYK